MNIPTSGSDEARRLRPDSVDASLDSVEPWRISARSNQTWSDPTTDARDRLRSRGGRRRG
ncbi:hypothetical protein M6B38_303330 [Iris pallida]|uniref:Uncharacterized protein n=1 Tax=Iris pallida TaxID=29817 RepID=A0AAX6HP91_IRIPA|nr:hypothetical protein M6B38_303330 [Iris pallida]